jgi:hypothetical protein
MMLDRTSTLYARPSTEVQLLTLSGQTIAKTSTWSPRQRARFAARWKLGQVKVDPTITAAAAMFGVSVPLVMQAIAKQAKTAEGLDTYRVHGCSRDDTDVTVNVLVDAKATGSARHLAQEIAGPEYSFYHTSICLYLIPDEIKNKLLSNEELYLAVPALDLRPRQRRTSR